MGEIKTPFNIEMILRACPELLRYWKAEPFILDAEDGRVVVRYITEYMLDG